MDDALWNHAVFSKNRDRLLTSDVAQRFFAEVNRLAKRLMSDEHFPVDGTLIQAARFILIWPIAGSAAWDLEGAVPDHSTFSKNRYGRFRESDIYRVLFEDVVGQCCSAGLVSCEGFAVDGSLTGSDAGRTRRVESVDAIRAGETKTRTVLDYSRRSILVIRFIRAKRDIFHPPIPPPRGM